LADAGVLAVDMDLGSVAIRVAAVVHAGSGVVVTLGHPLVLLGAAESVVEVLAVDSEGLLDLVLVDLLDGVLIGAGLLVALATLKDARAVAHFQKVY
jgi:hypothetical protein